MAKFKIGNRVVGDNYPPLVIAEIGINHNGNLDLAITLVDSAIKAGVEIIKHQTHSRRRNVYRSRNIKPGIQKKYFFNHKKINSEWKRKKLFDMLSQKVDY